MQVCHKGQKHAKGKKPVTGKKDGKGQKDASQALLQPALHPLAQWLLVHPHIIAAFAKWVKMYMHAGDLSSVRPKPQQWPKMIAFGIQHPIDDRASVLVMNQHAGDVVVIPPGWPHTVSNLLPYIKHAHDYCLRSELATYAAVHRDVASIFFRGEHVPQDYLAVSHVVKQGMLQLCEPKL